MSVFIDTGVLFAFLNRDDVHHEEAQSLVVKIAQGEWGSPIASDFVVDELFTLIRIRIRNPKMEAAAKQLFPMPDPAFPGLRLLFVGPQELEIALERFERHRSKGISFTDASHLALMETHEIDRLATFDKSLRTLAKALPR